MKLFTTVILLFAFGITMSAQTLKYPEKNCDGASVRPEGLHSWCHDSQDDFYDECECRFEKAMEEYEAQKEKLQNQKGRLYEEKQALLDNSRSHENTARDYQRKLTEEDNQNFENDKSAAMSEFQQAKSFLKKAITIEEEIQSIRTALSVYDTRDTSGITRLQTMIERLESDIEFVRNMEPRKTLTLTTGNYNGSAQQESSNSSSSNSSSRSGSGNEGYQEDDRQNTDTSNSASDSNDMETETVEDEVSRRERRQIEQIQEQTRINNEKNKAYAESASIAAEGLATGISEGIISGLSLNVGLRLDESETPDAIPTTIGATTFELGIQMGENSNSGFSVGYGAGGSSPYESGSSYLYVVGLDIGILNLVEFENSYALQLSVGGEYGTGTGEYTDSNYNGDDTWNITDDVSFYGGNINAKFMKYFIGGYGYGMANGSYTYDGETTKYDTFYSKVTLGLRIPF